MAFASQSAAVEDAKILDRTEVWLPLLRRLTEISPLWAVWKNVDSALTLGGDIDSIAPLETWPFIEQEFVRWSKLFGLGPVIVCPHVPYLLHLISLDPTERKFFELDVNCRKVFLGSTLFRPVDLHEMLQMDERGFRRLRPGAEGVLKLVQNGMRRGGKPDWNGIRQKKIAELMRGDPVGVRQAAKLFRRGEGAILEGVERVLQNEWSRDAMRSVEFNSVARSLAEPWNLAKRAWFRVIRKHCPVLQLVFSDRKVPQDRESWLAGVARSHRIYRTGPLERN
jgi:hypothetical protein